MQLHCFPVLALHYLSWRWMLLLPCLCAAAGSSTLAGNSALACVMLCCMLTSPGPLCLLPCMVAACYTRMCLLH